MTCVTFVLSTDCNDVTDLTTEQGYDNAPDLTPPMPNKRIAALTQTASITDRAAYPPRHQSQQRHIQ